MGSVGTWTHLLNVINAFPPSPAEVSVTGGSGSSGFPTLVLTIVAVTLVGVFLVGILIVCIIIFCMHRRSTGMQNVLNSNFVESNTNSPSLAKKTDACAEEIDAKASIVNDNIDIEVPPMSRGPDLTKDELEETEHWHELLPREGRSSKWSLKYSDSRTMGSVMRVLSRSHSRDKTFEGHSLNRKDSRNRLFSLGEFPESHDTVDSALRRSKSENGGLEAASKC